MSGWAIVGNVLWLVFGAGIGCFLFWLIAAGLLALTIVGLPFAFGAFRIALFAALPFGQRLVPVDEPIPGTALATVLWIILAGIWLALLHGIAGIAYCLTIIGIPFGLAHFKLASVSLSPIGKRVVPVGAA